MEKKFNVKKLEKLNNPERLEMIPPVYIWEKLKLINCRSIVDIGAGTGLFSRAFSSFMESGRVYALDISHIMVNWMAENILDGEQKIVPMLMGEDTVPLEDGIGDLVLMITLHHELDSPIELLKEAFRVLDNGGKVCIVDWKKEEMVMGPSLDIRCSSDEITNDLKQAGFNNIEVDESLKLFNIIIAEK